jgi:hypothetical protein
MGPAHGEPSNEATINNRNALLNSLFKSADGAIPIITGEFGDSTPSRRRRRSPPAPAPTHWC